MTSIKLVSGYYTFYKKNPKGIILILKKKRKKEQVFLNEFMTIFIVITLLFIITLTIPFMGLTFMLPTYSPPSTEQYVVTLGPRCKLLTDSELL